MFEEEVLETTEETTEESTEESTEEVVDYPEDLFGEEEPKEEPEEESEEEPEAEPEEEPEPVEQEKSFTLRHNHQDVTLTEKEVVSLAQKGMDYDRLRTQRDQLMNAPELTTLDSVAMQFGVNRGQMMEIMLSTFKDRQAVDLAERISQSDGIEFEAAYRLAQLQIENQSIIANQNRKSSVQAEEQKREQEQVQAMTRSFDRLFEKFPELREKGTFDELPEVVKKAFQEGESPIEAYQDYVLKERKKELEILKNNTKVKSKATGSTKPAKAPVGKDPFLDGLGYYE